MPIDLPEPPAPPRRRPFEFDGRWALACLVGFFAVVMGVNVVMMTMAFKTMPGADVKSAYETSQHFNEEIARMHEQDARGWKARAEIRRDDGATGVAFVLADKAGTPVSGLDVEARIQHPATRQHDRETALVEGEPGRYAATVEGLHAGGWTLALTARRAGEVVYVSRSRITLGD